MRVVYSDKLETLDSEQTLWVYNALDCAMTAEVLSKLLPQLTPETTWTYFFERMLQAPALEMMIRGIRVDPGRKEEALNILYDLQFKLDRILTLYGEAIDGKPLNVNSWHQIRRIFYDILKLPIQTRYDRQKKQEVITTDREALEKLGEDEIANPLVKAILATRDVKKKISVLTSGIDPDGKMRFSFNIAGTETGRWSSSKNITRGGMNAQNITEEIRPCFIADPGKKLCYIDLEQAESKAVAFLSGDPAYTNACFSGDLHTTVARLIWPKLAWNGDATHDRQLADQIFYRWFTYRDMSKRGGHGTNYLGTPRTMAKHLKVPVSLITEFQQAYFTAFPGIPRWHKSTASQLQKYGYITTPFNRRRRFLGRLWDNATIREAVAHVPQSMIADYMNKGILLSQRTVPGIELLLQGHDAVLFQYPAEQEHLCHQVASIISRPWNNFQCPTEVAVGWNFGKYHDEKMNERILAEGGKARPLNLSGLKKIKMGKSDLREPPVYVKPAPFAILDRRLS